MNRPRGPFHLGLDAFAQGDFEAARGHFEAALVARPASALVLGALGLARMKAGDLAGARQALERAEALGPSSEVAYHRGLVELSAERYEDALEAFQRAEQRGHVQVEARIGRAACLALMGEGAEARALLDGLSEGDRSHPEALYWYAVACAQDREEPGLRERAHELLEDLVAQPEGVSEWLRGRSHFLLASLLDDREEGYARAVEHYLAGLACDPTFVVGRNNLGAVYLCQGRHQEARAELLEALRLQPDYRRVHVNLARLYYDKAGEDEMRQDLERMTRELPPEELPRAVFGLVAALMDESRTRAFHEFYERGHAMKNLLALVGSRIQRIRRRQPQGDALEEALGGLKQQYDEAYARLTADLRLVRPQRERPQRIDVNATVRKVVRRARREAAEGLVVRTALTRGLPQLYGDAEAFQEAVVNLVRNAVQAMEGRGELDLATRLVGEGGRIELEVADRGPGLPGEATERLFQVGFTTKESGSGVGLALVRRTLHDLHGTIRAEDRPGGGAVFRMQVPVEVRYHPTRGLGLAARPIRLEEHDELNVDELA